MIVSTVSLSYKAYKEMERILRTVHNETFWEHTTRQHENGRDVGYFKTLILTLPDGVEVHFVGPTKQDRQFEVGSLVTVNTNAIGKVIGSDRDLVRVAFDPVSLKKA